RNLRASDEARARPYEEPRDEEGGEHEEPGSLSAFAEEVTREMDRDVGRREQGGDARIARAPALFGLQSCSGRGAAVALISTGAFPPFDGGRLRFRQAGSDARQTVQVVAVVGIAEQCA